MSDDIYRCPECGSAMVARRIISAASKGLTNWDAPLNQAVGDLDACTNCGHEWKPRRQLTADEQKVMQDALRRSVEVVAKGKPVQ